MGPATHPVLGTAPSRASAARSFEALSSRAALPRPSVIAAEEAGMHACRVVTLAALYGAGGSVIGPQLAERLGVPFLDRAIPRSVAERAGLSEAAVAGADEEPRSRWDHVVDALGRASPPTGASGHLQQIDLDERRLHAEIERFLAGAGRT